MRFGPEHKTLFKGMPLEAGIRLDRLTAFKVGGEADLLARPVTIEQVKHLVQTARENQIPVTLIGGGSNTLVSDDGIAGLVILTTGLKTGPCQVEGSKGPRVEALAGERLSTVCRFAADQGLSGLEWAAGIPGTVGGAVMMNAGSFGSDMAAVTASIDVFDTGTMACCTIEKENLDFVYRALNLEHNGIQGPIVLKVQIDLDAADPDTVKARFEKNLKIKKQTQPVNAASGGCFFKNPSPGQGAGYLIDKAGLKGEKRGGAMVSDRHANFIINQENARCQDILALQRLVQNRVYEKFNIMLEPEVHVIGR